MPINSVEILSLVTQVCEEEKLQVSIKESLKGGLLAGTTTTIGGLLGGPIGLAIGEVLQTFTRFYQQLIREPTRQGNILDLGIMKPWLVR